MQCLPAAWLHALLAAPLVCNRRDCERNRPRDALRLARALRGGNLESSLPTRPALRTALANSGEKSHRLIGLGDMPTSSTEKSEGTEPARSFTCGRVYRTETITEADSTPPGFRWSLGGSDHRVQMREACAILCKQFIQDVADWLHALLLLLLFVAVVPRHGNVLSHRSSLPLALTLWNTIRP